MRVGITQPWPPCTHTMRRHRHLRLEVGVVEHDVGRLAAELEEQALHGRAALLEDALAGDGGAGERDEVDERADRQLLTDEVVGRRDHVEHAGGDVGLLGDEATEVGRVPRRVGRGLQDHRVAGGERLADLLDRHLEREVPRHDAADDARGLRAPRCVPSARRTRCRSGSSRSHSKWSIISAGQSEAVLERRVELRAVGERDGGADLGDEVVAQVLLLAHDRLVELARGTSGGTRGWSTSRSRRTRGARRRWRAACPRRRRRRPRRAPLRWPG